MMMITMCCKNKIEYIRFFISGFSSFEDIRFFFLGDEDGCRRILSPGKIRVYLACREII